MGSDRLLIHLNNSKDSKIFNKNYADEALSTIKEVNKLLHHSAKLSDIIYKILEHVTQLFNAETACILLYNQESKKLIVQSPTFGFGNNNPEGRTIPLDSKTSNSINVFLSGKPFVSHDAINDPRVQPKIFNARNLVIAPLVVDDHCIGVIHIANKKNDNFTSDNIHFLMLLASDLAILIENAALLEKEKRQLNEAHQLNQQMLIYQNKLERILDIHSKMLEIVVFKGGIESIINTISNIIHSTVFLEDLNNNLLYSSDINIEISLDTLLKENLWAKVKLENRETARIRIANQEMIVVPVKGKCAILGYLAAEDSYDQSDEDIILSTLEQGAMTIALEMMEAKIKQDVETRYRSNFIEDLLSGNLEDETILLLANLFNYNFSTKSRVVIFEIYDKIGKLYSRAEKRVSYQEIIFASTNQLLSEAIAVQRGNNTVLLIVPVASITNKHLTNKLNEICDSFLIAFENKNISVGIGQECLSMSDYKKSFEEATKALSISKILHQRDRVFYYENLGVYRILYEVKDRKVLENFVKSKLGQLLEYDKKKEGHLTETLELYLQTGKSLKETATALYIHVGTVKYRLQRIKEIIDVDLHDEKELFELRLALHVKKLITKE